MVAPGPDAAQLKDIVALALRTPDHGKLAPWRIVTIGDDQRDAFAALLKQAWVAENPGAAGMDLSALDQFAHQAPTVSRQISRSEEHTSELQSLMRISYAVFCLKKKKHNTQHNILT